MQMKNLAVLVALPLTLVACSGGGSGSSSGAGIVAPGASINSQFIDAPVKGLKVAKDSGNDETKANGIFSCNAGEEVSFWLKEIGASGKGLFIGKTFCGSHIYIDELGDHAVKAGALIQSLSTGDHASRKELDLSAFNATDFDLKTEVPDITDIAVDQAKLTAVVAKVKTDTNIAIEEVKLDQARTHMNLNLPAQDDSILDHLTGKEHTLNLKALATNPEGHCWEQVQVKVELEPVPVNDAGDVAYRFKVNEYLAWEGTPTIADGYICDGTEKNPSTDVYYECHTDPVSKIMRDRSVSGTQYVAKKFEVLKGEPAICEFSDDQGFDFNMGEDGLICAGDGKTPRNAASDLDLSFGLGWNFNISVTNSSYTVNFNELAIDIGAELNADKEVTAYTQQKFTCSYSVVEALDMEDSGVE